jgi:mannose-6-phosphate isomerase
MKGETEGSCIILSSLGAEVQVRYGDSLDYSEKLARGQTMVLPAALGKYCIEGSGRLICSYVPAPGDEVWHLWEEQNRRAAR